MARGGGDSLRWGRVAFSDQRASIFLCYFFGSFSLFSSLFGASTFLMFDLLG